MTSQINVLNQFKPIFEINSRYLIIEGPYAQGKFYAACQKVIAECLKAKSRAAISTNDNGCYFVSILKDVVGCDNYTLNKSLSLVVLKNGSKIYLRNPLYHVDYIIIHGTNYVDSNTFNAYDRLYFKQMIITCNDIPKLHWIEKLSKNDECTVFKPEGVNFYNQYKGTWKVNSPIKKWWQFWKL